jgi:NAD(P)H dehydrogenase (quinone)
MNYYIDTFVDEVRMSLGNGAILGLAEHRVGFVSRDDVAAAAAGILTGEEHAGAIYNATGPRLYSGAERCAAISAAVGKRMDFVTLPEEGMRAAFAQAGLPATTGELIINIQKALAVGGFDLVTGDVERLSGRRPQSLEHMLQQVFP